MRVKSKNAIYTDDYIQSNYQYQSSLVECTNGFNNKNNSIEIEPLTYQMTFRIQKKISKVGLMLVGLCGNNGTTVVGGLLANKMKLSWKNKTGVQYPNWFGSMVLSSEVNLGYNKVTNEFVHAPISDLVPLLDVDSIVVGGWDIDGTLLGDACTRAQVFDYDLQRQLYDKMQTIECLPGIYNKDFIAANQEERATNIIKGDLQTQINQIRNDIANFKAKNSLDKIIVVWTATTERFTNVQVGIHDTYENLEKAIKNNCSEISPSALYAIGSILEGCSYINGSPQNTFIPAIIELASRKKIFIGGDDFKSGQTKLKSVLVDFLVSAGIKPLSIVSYNHLGNNDGKNLSSPSQFRSKEVSKSTVIDDMISSNTSLYKKDEKPHHTVVIKYVPPVGDSKRALDEYYSEIFMGGKNTIVIHNTCEDSLLAAPIIIDLVLLTELCERIEILNTSVSDSFEKLNSILSLLSYFCKAPIAPNNTPVTNALFSQRLSITNFIRACIGLPPDNHMFLENKLNSFLKNDNQFSHQYI